MKQCQGGWCRARANCAHYWAPRESTELPADRLCAPGDERPVLIGSDAPAMPDTRAWLRQVAELACVQAVGAP